MRLALLALLLTGCASGIKVTPDEAVACRKEGCSVWTDGELADLVKRAFIKGQKSTGTHI